MSWNRAATALIAGALCTCGSSLRKVPTGLHPPAAADPIVVDYPPPPAKPEAVAADPGPPCLWLDGHWAWAGRRWNWIGGSWVVPPPDCYYARSILVWYSPPDARADAGAPSIGRLYYTEPKWHSNKPRGACPEPTPCGGRAAVTTQP
jgi:hypothetical protein